MFLTGYALGLLLAVTAVDGADERLHATVTLEGGRVLTGVLREESEDAGRHNHFTAYRTDNPWSAFIDEDELARQRRDEFYRTHGVIDRIAYALGADDEGDRRLVFACRYGNLVSLTRDDEGDIVAVTLDGGEHRLRDHGRDMSSDLVLGADEPLEVDWDEVRSVVFSPVPGLPSADQRPLWGTVTGTDGTHTGWIQWDRSECLAGDILDGEVDGKDREVLLGDVAAIERIDDRSCRIRLHQGDEFAMSGTNDVNEDNRGIVVAVPDLGNVTLPWHRFTRVEFSAPPADRAAAGFAPGSDLHGSVTTDDGRRHTGRIIFDLEEGATWEIFDAEAHGVKYALPFAVIARLERHGDDGAIAFLRDGRRLEFDRGADLGKDNDGVVVVTTAGTVILPWSEVAVVEFAP